MRISPWYERCLIWFGFSFGLAIASHGFVSLACFGIAGVTIMVSCWMLWCGKEIEGKS